MEWISQQAFGLQQTDADADDDDDDDDDDDLLNAKQKKTEFIPYSEMKYPKLGIFMQEYFSSKIRID